MCNSRALQQGLLVRSGPDSRRLTDDLQLLLSGIQYEWGDCDGKITVLQELRTLGKGGYGLVVAAVNRLDGRQYAVKKICMPSAAPVAYSRLMREVSTLARLQHPHVVRYFQVTSLLSSWQSDVSSKVSCKVEHFRSGLLLLYFSCTAGTPQMSSKDTQTLCAHMLCPLL